MNIYGKKSLMMNGCCTVLTWLILLIAPLQLSAGAKLSPQAQAKALQDIYGSLISMSFDFSQVTRTGGRERTGSGSAVFYKPNFSASQTAADDTPDRPVSVMRWTYAEPDPQVIINDGETLSIYTEKDRQLIKTDAKEIETDITYAFFAGTRSLLDDFEARPADQNYVYTSAQELDTLVLAPRKPHNQIKAVQIWFDDQGIIHHLLLEDHFDSVTELNFTNIQRNSLPPFDRVQMDRIISFQIPPGTEIISQ